MKIENEIVMKNVFGVFNDNVFRKYDMKGSKKDRKVSIEILKTSCIVINAKSLYRNRKI